MNKFLFSSEHENPLLGLRGGGGEVSDFYFKKAAEGACGEEAECSPHMYCGSVAFLG